MCPRRSVTISTTCKTVCERFIGTSLAFVRPGLTPHAKSKLSSPFFSTT